MRLVQQRNGDLHSLYPGFCYVMELVFLVFTRFHGFSWFWWEAVAIDAEEVLLMFCFMNCYWNFNVNFVFVNVGIIQFPWCLRFSRHQNLSAFLITWQWSVATLVDQTSAWKVSNLFSSRFFDCTALLLQQVLISSWVSVLAMHVIWIWYKNSWLKNVLYCLSSAL